MAELVDARDSKSRFLGSMGSIPIAGILLINKGLKGFWSSFNELVVALQLPL